MYDGADLASNSLGSIVPLVPPDLARNIFSDWADFGSLQFKSVMGICIKYAYNTEHIILSNVNLQII